MIFKDRYQAGYLLAGLINDRIEELSSFKFIVIGIPRGGVVVAKSVAERIGSDLSVIFVQKIGAPGNKELAIGAVAQGSVVSLEEDLVERLGVKKDYLEQIIRQKKNEIKRRAGKFLSRRKISFKGKSVLLVDDGIATGSTVKAAVAYLRKMGTKTIILAVPVSSFDAVAQLEPLVDGLFVLHTPRDFRAVGEYYEDFPQVTDSEVEELLSQK